MGHPRQFVEACIRELFQKAVSHLHKSKGHGPVLALALFLFRSEPGRNPAARNFLGEMHHSAPIVWAKTEKYRR